MTLDLDLYASQSPEPTGAPALEGVGFWRRAAARGIDTLVHLLVGFAAGVAAVVVVAIASALRDVSPAPAIQRLSANTFVGFAAALIGSTSMHVLCEGLHGSTLGKRLCGITVIGEDGRPSTLAGALKRGLRIGDEWGHTMVVRIATLDASVHRSGLRFVLALLLGAAADGCVVFAELGSRLIL